MEHFIRASERVTVLSDYPDVFIGTGAEVEPFSRERIDVLAHYVNGKADPSTTQWQDVCRSAGVSVPLRFEWTVRNRRLIDELRADAAGRPLVLVHGGRVPMGRTDGFGKELLPERRAFVEVIEALDDCFTVRVGKGADLYALPVDVDLNDATSVSDLLDIGLACDRVVAQCSFAIPLAEAFDRPLLVVWAASGMSEHRHPYIRRITPRKVLSKPTSRFVIDDWPDWKIKGATRAFCNVS